MLLNETQQFQGIIWKAITLQNQEAGWMKTVYEVLLNDNQDYRYLPIPTQAEAIVLPPCNRT